MRTAIRLALAASAACLIFACAKEAEQSTTETATSEAAPEPAATEEIAATEGETDPNQIGAANVIVSVANGAPVFSQESDGYCAAGSCQSGVQLNTGDIDLSTYPPGDVRVTVWLDATAVTAGYSFPTDGYQAIGIAVIPPGQSAPAPGFGADFWPTGFLAPVVAGDAHSVAFTDLEADQNAYEYSVGLNGPNGRVVMDPEIKNGGGGGGNEPEPEPEPQE